ncbi:MAG: ABC transporter ATP-binding protein [Lachnospiraceae bacterium]|nr:ABC transporter ATP-binding protein [Lachnospiraceae bacterium]
MVIRTESLQKDFIRKSRNSNVFTAVMPVSLMLEPGRLYAIKGRSGSGKSTLLNMLAGILTPTAGEVFYDDIGLYGMDDGALSRFRNERIGFIPQGKSAVMSLSVLENVNLPDILYGKRDELRARELLDRFGIGHLADAMPSELSGGELKRMAIARAMLKSPQILFADEPTSDLDDHNTRIVFDVLREAADSGSIVVVVTHENDAAAISDKVYRMDAGKIVSDTQYS